MLPVLGRLLSGVLYGLGIVMFVLLYLAMPQFGQALLLLVGLVMSIGSLDVPETTPSHQEEEEEEEEEVKPPLESLSSKRERRACASHSLLQLKVKRKAFLAGYERKSVKSMPIPYANDGPQDQDRLPSLRIAPEGATTLKVELVPLESLASTSHQVEAGLVRSAGI